MKTVECTFKLPEATLEALEQKVSPENQGTLVAALIEQWLDGQKTPSIREQYIEGLKDMEDISLELERAYHPLEEEVHRALPE